MTIKVKKLISVLPILMVLEDQIIDFLRIISFVSYNILKAFYQLLIV